MNVPEFEVVEMCMGCRKPFDEVHPFARMMRPFGADKATFFDRDGEWINIHCSAWATKELRPTNISLCAGEAR